MLSLLPIRTLPSSIVAATTPNASSKALEICSVTYLVLPLKTIDEASKTLHNLTNVTVLEQNAKISGNKIVEYRVDLDISFQIEPYQEQPQDDTDNM